MKSEKKNPFRFLGRGSAYLKDTTTQNRESRALCPCSNQDSKALSPVFGWHKTERVRQPP